MNVLRIFDRIIENHGGETTCGCIQTCPHNTLLEIEDIRGNIITCDIKHNIFEIKHPNGAINRAFTLDGLSLMLHALYSN